jgi:hypothetical protein
MVLIVTASLCDMVCTMHELLYIPSVLEIPVLLVFAIVVDDCKNIRLDFLLSATQASIAVSKSVSHACIFEQRHTIQAQHKLQEHSHVLVLLKALTKYKLSSSVQSMLTYSMKPTVAVESAAFVHVLQFVVALTALSAGVSVNTGKLFLGWCI